MRCLCVLGVLLFATSTFANEISSVYDETDPNARFLFSNNTSLSVSFASLIYGAFALIALGILAALVSYFLFESNGDTGYSSYSSYGATSGYGSGRAAESASPYASVFDKLSVLDWIAMMEEVYRKFDATSIDCQKRLVCELHQNENTWGSTARKMNDAFSYLQYFELLNLPEDLRGMLEEYLDAANKGRTSQAKCDDLYPTCEFSMKTLISKYNSI